MRADEEASSLLRIASRPNTARVGVMVFMLSIVWAGALASVAVAQEACNIQDVAIDQVDGHVPVDSTEFEGFLDAGRVSDQVAVRAWSVEGGGAGLVLFLFEEPTVDAAARELGSFTTGIRDRALDSGIVPEDLGTTRSGVIGTSVTLQGVVQRVVETSTGHCMTGLSHGTTRT